MTSGRRSGDLTHPLIYCPELFKQEFVSSVADMKVLILFSFSSPHLISSFFFLLSSTQNSVADRSNAQSSCAAQFIANHFGDYSGKWLHVDMVLSPFSPPLHFPLLSFPLLPFPLLSSPPLIFSFQAYPVRKGERATGYGVALLNDLFVFNEPS